MKNQALKAVFYMHYFGLYNGYFDYFFNILAINSFSGIFRLIFSIGQTSSPLRFIMHSVSLLYETLILFFAKYRLANLLIVGDQTTFTLAQASKTAAARPITLSKTTAPRIWRLYFLIQKISGLRCCALDLKIIFPFLIRTNDQDFRKKYSRLYLFFMRQRFTGQLQNYRQCCQLEQNPNPAISHST